MNSLLPVVIQRKMPVQEALLSRLKRVVIRPAAIPVLLVFLIAGYLYYIKTVQKGFLKMETIEKITFMYNKKINAIDTLHSRIMADYKSLAALFGPSNYAGDILFTSTNSNSFAELSLKLLNKISYIVHLSEPVDRAYLQETTLIHELAHVLYQDQVIEFLPEFGLEGIACYMTNRVMGEDFLIAGLNAFYLRSFPGLIDPDVSLSSLPDEIKSLYYAMGGIFFTEVSRIDPDLLLVYLQRPKAKYLTWTEMLQDMIEYSSKKDEVIDFIQSCKTLLPVSKTYFFVPIKLEDSVLQILVYLDMRHKKALHLSGSMSLKVNLTYGKTTYTLVVKPFLKDGVGNIYINLPENALPKKLDFCGTYAGISLSEILNIHQ